MKLSPGAVWRFGSGLLRGPWLVVLETLAVVAGLAILALGVLLWRLSLGPLDLGFARPWLQSALNRTGQDVRVEADRLALQWEGAGQPVLLGLQNMRLVHADGRGMLSVEQAGVSLSLARLLVGQIEPRTVILDGPALRIVREENNSLTLGLAQKAPEPPGPSGTTAEPSAVDAGAWLWRLTATDKKTREALPALVRGLKRVELRNARLMVEDHVNQVSWFLPQTDVSLTLKGGDLSASLSILMPGETVPSVFSIQASQTDAGDALEVQAVVKGFDPRLISDRFGPLAFLGRQTMRIDLEGMVRFGADMRVEAASASLETGAAALVLPQIYSKPLALDFLRMEGTYDPAAGTISIPDARISAAGVALEAAIVLDPARQRLSATVKGSGEDVPTSRLQAVWPDAIPHDNSTQWVHRRIAGGHFRNVQAALTVRRDPAQPEPVIEQAEARFAFEGVKVDYRPPLYPVEDAAGEGHFDAVRNALVFKGERAVIRDMRAQNITAAFEDILTAGKGTADIAFDLSGPLSTALSYIALEPIRMGDKLPVQPKAVKGQSDLNVRIKFPTIRDLPAERVEVKVKGTVNDALLPGIVAGLDISGGPLRVETFDGYFTAAGKGKLGGRDIDMEWTQYLALAKAPFAARARARLVADKSLRDHFHVDLDEYLNGSVPVDLVYTEDKGDTARVDVTADLSPARIAVKPFLYNKPPGPAASARLQLGLRKGRAEKVENLSVEAPDLALSGGSLGFVPLAGGGSSLRSGRFESLRLGETEARFSFQSEGEGQRLRLELEGATLDARAFLDDSYRKENGASPPARDGASDAPTRPLSIAVRVKRMRTNGEESVRDARAAIEIDRSGILTQIDFSAQAGAGSLGLNFGPDAAGRRALRCEAADAGATLRAFGVYDKIRGGTLRIYGEPMNNRADGDISGSVRLENFRVVKAPVLAQLVSAMSIPGLLQSLSTDGLSFTRAESAFDWLRAEGRSAYQFRDGRTSGNSLGLTFMGTVDKNSGTVDLSGTVAPMSEINSLIGGIPLIGDILAGGKDGAVIAATYAIKGDADRPRVLVNPLAALTPGILRRLLFEDSAPQAPRRTSPPRRAPRDVNR